MPIGDRDLEGLAGLEDLVAGGVVKPAGSEAVIEVEAFGPDREGGVISWRAP